MPLYPNCEPALSDDSGKKLRFAHEIQSGIFKVRDLSLSILLMLSLLAVSSGLCAIDLKVDQVTLNSPVSGGGIAARSQVVNFPFTFSAPPAVFILPDNTNPDPMTFRVHTVTTTGFEIFVSESEGEDATTYPAIPFNYLAILPGTYTLASGDVLEVGITNSVTNFQATLFGGDSFFTQNFSAAAAARYAATGVPVVLTEIQTLTSDPTLLSGVSSPFTRATQPWLETIQAGGATANVRFALERAETSAGTISGSGETIAWLAIDNGADTNFLDDAAVNIEIKAVTSTNSIDNNCTAVAMPTNFTVGNPIAFASQTTRNGNNGGWMRECGTAAGSVSLFLQEDRANDAEIAHINETSQVLAFSMPFVLSAGMPMTVGSGIIPQANASASSLSFTTVIFAEPMNARPVVFPLATNQGVAPAMVRVRNVSASGFDITQLQPASGTGAAPSMTVDYLAIVPGNHTLPDGTRLLAGEANVVAFQGSGTGGGTSFDTTAVSYAPAFSTVPAVLLATQTFNSDPAFDPSFTSIPFFSVASQNSSISGIDVALDYVKTTVGVPPSAERVGFLAAEPIESTIKVFDGSTLDFKILISPTVIEGVDEGCDLISFVTAFSTATPRVLANRNVRNGGDGGWLRRCSLSASQVGLQVDEDETGGSNRSHGADESAGIFAFESDFDWEPPEFANAKTVSAEWDPVNSFVDPKSIPGAFVRYQLTISNPGRIEADPNSVVVEDAVPVNTRLFVGDLDGAGCLFDFIDGTDSSGLSLDCVAGVEFRAGTPPCASADNFCPISDFSFADEWDSADILAFRLTFSNAFTSSNGSSLPEFQLEYRVRVD